MTDRGECVIFTRMNIRLLLSLLGIVAQLVMTSPAEAELVCARVKTVKGAPALSVVRTAAKKCPRGTELILDTSELVGAPGERGVTGPTGATGPAGSNGTDGDLNILCYATVNMDTDTVTTFGGNGTTGVIALQNGGMNNNLLTCNGSYPGVSSLNDVSIFVTQSTNSSVPVAASVADLDGSSASGSQIAVTVRTSDGNEHYNVLVLGPSS